jgi:pimeloyl-ACP methyl ester carboxylesterase
VFDVPGADGVQINVLEWSREGVPLVFIHGFGNDAHVWDEIAPAVAPYYRTLALTLRGHGDSGRSAEPGREPEALVRDVEAALTALRVERLVLVGHSLGGRVSLQFASRNPGKLAGLVLVDFAPELDARGTTRIREEAMAQARRQDRSFATLDEYLRLLEVLYPAVKSATLQKLARHWTRQRPDGRYELKQDRRPPRMPSEGEIGQLRERARQDTERLWTALREMPCPTLLVRGAASDVLDSDVAERAHELLPKGKLVEIARAGHSVMLDNPEDFTTALTDFVLG